MAAAPCMRLTYSIVAVSLLAFYTIIFGAYVVHAEVLSWYYPTTGYSETPQNFATNGTTVNKISMDYTPTDNEWICGVASRWKKANGTTNHIRMTLYQGGTDPENGTELEHVTVAVEDMPVSVDWEYWDFANCRQLINGTKYYFTFTQEEGNDVNYTQYYYYTSALTLPKSNPWVKDDTSSWTLKNDREFHFQLFFTNTPQLLSSVECTDLSCLNFRENTVVLSSTRSSSLGCEGVYFRYEIQLQNEDTSWSTVYDTGDFGPLSNTTIAGSCGLNDRPNYTFIAGSYRLRSRICVPPLSCEAMSEWVDFTATDENPLPPNIDYGPFGNTIRWLFVPDPSNIGGETLFNLQANTAQLMGERQPFSWYYDAKNMVDLSQSASGSAFGTINVSLPIGNQNINMPLPLGDTQLVSAMSSVRNYFTIAVYAAWLFSLWGLAWRFFTNNAELSSEV